MQDSTLTPSTVWPEEGSGGSGELMTYKHGSWQHTSLDPHRPRLTFVGGFVADFEHPSVLLRRQLSPVQIVQAMKAVNPIEPFSYPGHGCWRLTHLSSRLWLPVHWRTLVDVSHTQRGDTRLSPLATTIISSRDTTTLWCHAQNFHLWVNILRCLKAKLRWCNGLFRVYIREFQWSSKARSLTLRTVASARPCLGCVLLVNVILASYNDVSVLCPFLIMQERILMCWYI